MTLTDFIDVSNKKHLQALYYFLQKGMFPVDFVPSHISIEKDWENKLIRRVALDLVAEHLQNGYYKGAGFTVKEYLNLRKKGVIT